MQIATSIIPKWKSYLALAKPGIVLGNALTAFGGFALAGKGCFEKELFFFMLLGLSLVIASGCTFNNLIDCQADRKMARTQKRPLATGEISLSKAFLFGILSGFLGIFLLAGYVNLLTALIAFLGFINYVFVYSFLKYRTHHATLLGGIAGAVPPVIGYTAISNALDERAFLLFATLLFWQMPHFFAIALYRLEEYAAASIPVLPIKKGIGTTKIQMLLYTLAFTSASALFSVRGHRGFPHLIAILLLGGLWVLLSLTGFSKKDHRLWARKMFLFSLIVVTVFSLTLPFFTP